MNEFDKMINRMNVSNIVCHIMNGIEDIPEITTSYNNKVENAFDEFISKYEKILPVEERMNLYDALIDFAVTNNQVYLEMGLIIGVQLFKGLDQGYKNLDAGLKKAILKKMLECLEESEADGSRL